MSSTLVGPRRRPLPNAVDIPNGVEDRNSTRATIPFAFGSDMERKTCSRFCSGTVRVLHRFSGLALAIEAARGKAKGFLPPKPLGTRHPDGMVNQETI